MWVSDYSVSDKEAHIYCESVKDSGTCPVCQNESHSIQMYQERTVRDMALLGRKVFLHLRSRQFYCQDCGRYFNESFEFLDKNGTMTIRYEQYLYFLSENLCISDVSVKEDIAWASVQRIYCKYAERQISGRAVWHQVRYLLMKYPSKRVVKITLVYWLIWKQV